MKGNLTQRSQAGFTLVELAIVMIIIGLLIAGVLKGQELIGNAQVTATVAQAKSIDAATSTFKDTYNGLPGDLLNSTNRLPNCGATPCSTAGNGNGRLDNTFTGVPSAGEGQRFFVHLNAANLLSGIVPGTDTVGGNYPATKISGNAFVAASTPDGAVGGFPDVLGATALSSGTYLAATNNVAAATSAATVGLRPSQALRIDTKLDDADPTTGDVRGYGGATCGGNVAPAIYTTSNNGGTCGLYIKIQN